MVNPVESNNSITQGTAPNHPFATPEEPWNYEWVIDLEKGATDDFYYIKKDLSVMLASKLVGMGNVDLHSLTVRYTTTDAKQYVFAAIHSDKYDKDVKTAAGVKGALKFYSNAYNFGVTEDVDLVLPNFVSRQIQPTSPIAPMPKLFFKAHKSVEVSLIFRILHHGPVRVMEALSCDSF
jgi:hypothetical protein